MISLLEITPEAEQDIVTITSHLKQQDDLVTARNVVTELKNQFQDLVTHPENGRIGVCEDTREVVITGLPYIVVYRKKDTSVSIIRVLHGSN